MPDTPLNPDALEAACLAAIQNESPGATFADEEDRRDWLGWMRPVVSAYLAAALPEVTSVEELDQLPMHTYVQGADGFKHAKDWNGGWHLIVNRPSSAPHLSGSIELPARVLHRPEVKP